MALADEVRREIQRPDVGRRKDKRQSMGGHWLDADLQCRRQREERVELKVHGEESGRDKRILLRQQGMALRAMTRQNGPHIESRLKSVGGHHRLLDSLHHP